MPCRVCTRRLLATFIRDLHAGWSRGPAGTNFYEISFKDKFHRRSAFSGSSECIAAICVSYSMTSSGTICAGSFGQPRFPESLRQQRRV